MRAGARPLVSWLKSEPVAIALSLHGGRRAPASLPGTSILNLAAVVDVSHRLCSWRCQEPLVVAELVGTLICQYN